MSYWPDGLLTDAYGRWLRQQTVARLVLRYGVPRTLRIINGQDAAANADLAKWRAFGARNLESVA